MMRDRRRTSRRRFEVIAGPAGYLSIVPAGSPMRTDRYRHWITLVRVSVPRRVARRTDDAIHQGALSRAAAEQLKVWAILAYRL